MISCTKRSEPPRITRDVLANNRDMVLDKIGPCTFKFDVIRELAEERRFNEPGYPEYEAQHNRTFGNRQNTLGRQGSHRLVYRSDKRGERTQKGLNPALRVYPSLERGLEVLDADDGGRLGQCNGNYVEAALRRVVWKVFGKPQLCSPAHAVLLCESDGLLRSGKVRARARLDLYKDDGGGVAGDYVYLAPGRVKVAGKNLVALRFEKAASAFLSHIAFFLFFGRHLK